MKKGILSCLLIPVAFLSSSFLAYDTEIQNLVSSKWISPINDTCSDRLCFISESKVMYYSCEHHLDLELGYKILDGKIEIEAYSSSQGEPKSKLILMEEDGVLTQLSSQQNKFPRNFIKVPEGSCD